MPTRLYLSQATVADVNPAFAAWVETDGAVRRKLFLLDEINEALALGTRLGWAAGNTQLDRQYVSNPMDSGIVFLLTTQVKCQLASREFANTDNSTSVMGVRVFSEDGLTLRATFAVPGQLGPTTEFINNASLRNKTYASPTNLAEAYTTVAGDRLVIEVGYVDSAGTTPEAQSRYGAPDGTADHGENETETTSLVPWVEFSNTITFQAPVVETRIYQAIYRGREVV